MSSDVAPEYDAFAVAAPGLESIVASELTGLGIAGLTVVDGGVEFPATRRQLYQVNLHLRTASRVLIRLARFRALTFAELERRLRRVPWERVLSHGGRVALRVTCRKSRLYHSGAVAERIERDLVDRFGANIAASSRGEEETEEPANDGQLIVVRFDHDHCTISADSSGAHLHQRGYRTHIAVAPMRETLAAAMVLASGWDRHSPLIDPFCGSGTIPIEAALIAANMAPGRGRVFQFMQWPGFNAAVWSRLLGDVVGQERSEALPAIIGSDRNAAAIRAATANAERAGVADLVLFERRDALRIEAPVQAGWVVSNPPYGVRLGDVGETRSLIASLGATLRQRFGGWQVALLVPPSLERALGVHSTPVLETRNGGLKVRLLATRMP